VHCPEKCLRVAAGCWRLGCGWYAVAERLNGYLGDGWLGPPWDGDQVSTLALCLEMAGEHRESPGSPAVTLRNEPLARSLPAGVDLCSAENTISTSISSLKME